MKNILAFFIFIFCGFILSAQAQVSGAGGDSGQAPYFSGCVHLAEGSAEKRTCSDESLTAYIMRRLQVNGPSDKEGVVYISFVIDERGKVIEPVVVRGLGGAQDSAALEVVKSFPDWEPARDSGRTVKIKLNLPIKFTVKNDPQFNPAYHLSWGTLKGPVVQKVDVIKNLPFPVSVRDETGALVEIGELNFVRQRHGKYIEARSAGVLSEDMKKMIHKLKPGDVLTITATIQKGGKFSYTEKNFTIR